MTIFWIVMGFLLVWAILLVIASIVVVETGSIAAVFRFKKFRRVLKPGLNFIIPIFESVERYLTQTHQHELPDEPENIDRVNDTPERGKKLPFRVLQSGKEEAIFYVRKDEGDPTIIRDSPITAWNAVHFQELDEPKKKSLEEDSLHAPLTSENAVVVEWHLDGSNRDSIENFIQNVTPESGRNREDEVRKRMEDMVARTLQELLGPVTLGHAREMITLFSMLIKERLEILVGEKPDPNIGPADKPWGIHIRDAYIKNIHPGRRVNEARADAAASVSKKQGTIRDAEAKAEATRVQADADAFSEGRKGEGEAARITAMAGAMKDENARFVATLDVAEQVLPKANTIIVPAGDMGVIASVLALGGEMAKSKK